jgi:hypothetical protein
MESQNTPLETSDGDDPQLNIQYPSRIYYSMTSNLTMRKTKFWEKKSHKWSDKIYIWRSKPPGHTRHLLKGSRMTPLWASSPRRWPPTCSSSTTTSGTGTINWRRKIFHHGDNHFSKRRSESKNESQRDHKSESQKANKGYQKSERQYSKTSFLVQIKFITEDSEQTQTQTLIIN